MKNILKFALIGIISFCSVVQLFAQEEPETVYRRSSLYPMLLEVSPVFSDQSEAELNQIVMSAYGKAPFPEKYNDHRLDAVSFSFSDYSSISAEELQKAELGVKSEDDTGEEAAEEKDKKDKTKRKVDEKYLAAINKYIEENDVARGMVAKWFNRKEDGSFDMSLIHERGSYNASAMEVQLASGSIRGMAAIKDAGEELIKNTFFVVNRMMFVKNEPIARGIRDVAIFTAEQTISNTLALEAAKATARAVYKATKDGYSVWTVSYLYQLEWNDEIANQFYMDMWMGSDNIDEARKNLFESTDIFKLNYVGFQKAKSVVLIGIDKSPQEILQVATIRNIDKVYVKLQKAYDVFKTKTPILSTDPLIAKIGMKEGVDKGDKFDVLEMVVDKKTGLTRYDKVSTIKAKEVWDNRYEMTLEDTKTEDDGGFEGTVFKGGKKIMAGMLLRQVK